eukprot:875078_1
MGSSVQTMDSLSSLQPAPKTKYGCPDPIYYYSKKEDKEYIILTPHIYDTNKCFKYDIVEDEWIHFATYPQGLKPECHTSTMDEENDLLYLTHGWSDIFATFNMNSNKWNVMSKSEQEGTKYNIIHRNLYSPSLMLPNSELHVW